MKLKDSRRDVQRIVLCLLLLAALVSVCRGAQNALYRSQDFQWSGAQMLTQQHIDPWHEYLRGDPNHLIYQTQIPNYLPLFYILIAPLGLLPRVPAQMVWLCCNVVFALASGCLVGRFFGIAGQARAPTPCLFLVTTPVRTTLGNGQQALLVLVFWCLSLLATEISAGRAVVCGLSYFKFNFAPPVALLLLLRAGWRAMLRSAFPSLLAIAIVWLWLGEVHQARPLFALGTEPFQVAQRGYFPRGGGSNLMDVLEPVLRRLHVPERLWDPLTLSAALLASFLLLYRATRAVRRWGLGWEEGLVGTASVGRLKILEFFMLLTVLWRVYGLRDSTVSLVRQERVFSQEALTAEPA